MRVQLIKTFLFCLTLGSTSFTTFANASTTSLSGKWSIICQDDCIASQLLVNENKTLRYSATVSNTEEANLLQMKMVFPLGLYLPTNIAFKVDAIEKIIPFTTCLPSGCHALMLLDESLQNALANSEDFQVRFFTTSETENELTFPLAGFKKALDTIKK